MAKFIQPTGKLTRTGKLLFQKATEAYVYSILGAQAKVVRDSVAQDYDSILVDNIIDISSF